jgi:hypothetical protein
MIERIRRMGVARRRRRTLNKIRREFENHGHRLDGVSDFEIEVVLTRGGREVNATSLSAKTIFLALRRLSAGDRQGHIRKSRRSGVLTKEV